MASISQWVAMSYVAMEKGNIQTQAQASWTDELIMIITS
jgi:hypothetical protein